jgi:two-component system response regulator SaeR
MTEEDSDSSGTMLKDPPHAGGKGNAPSILLVDDDDSVITVVRRYLEPKGFTVTAASDGLEGLALFRERRFDVLVTDIMMPGMGGWELISAVHGEDPTLPIIIITGYAGAGGEWSEENLASKGVVALYHKPINFVLLRTQIQSLCHSE